MDGRMAQILYYWGKYNKLNNNSLKVNTHHSSAADLIADDKGELKYAIGIQKATQILVCAVVAVKGWVEP